MVSERCKIVVKEELKKLGLHYIIVDMGVVDIMENLTAEQRKQINIALLRSGLELMDDKKAVLVENIKNVIIEMIHYKDDMLKTNFSDYISLNVNDNFVSLNTLFAEIEGITIEKYIIKHKVERVKEYLVYDKLSLAEIAHKMHYSNVAQLSSQFKRITGLTPSYFKQIRHTRNINPESN